MVGEDSEGISVAPLDRSWPTIRRITVLEGKRLKNRLHLDLRADAVTIARALDRLRALGARPTDVGQDEDVSWGVLSGPEGNGFCLLSRSVQELDTDP